MDPAATCRGRVFSLAGRLTAALVGDGPALARRARFRARPGRGDALEPGRCGTNAALPGRRPCRAEGESRLREHRRRPWKIDGRRRRGTRRRHGRWNTVGRVRRGTLIARRGDAVAISRATLVRGCAARGIRHWAWRVVPPKLAGAAGTAGTPRGTRSCSSGPMRKALSSGRPWAATRRRSRLPPRRRLSVGADDASLGATVTFDRTGRSAVSDRTLRPLAVRRTSPTAGLLRAHQQHRRQEHWILAASMSRRSLRRKKPQAQGERQLMDGARIKRSRKPRKSPSPAASERFGRKNSPRISLRSLLLRPQRQVVSAHGTPRARCTCVHHRIDGAASVAHGHESGVGRSAGCVARRSLMASPRGEQGIFPWHLGRATNCRGASMSATPTTRAGLPLRGDARRFIRLGQGAGRRRPKT
jgi:hypothetical protein